AVAVRRVPTVIAVARIAVTVAVGAADNHRIAAARIAVAISVAAMVVAAVIAAGPAAVIAAGPTAVTAGPAAARMAGPAAAMPAPAARGSEGRSGEDQGSCGKKEKRFHRTNSLVQVPPPRRQCGRPAAGFKPGE